MGLIKGQTEFKKWQSGKKITRKEAMLAQCYICNGEEQSNEDCEGKQCPLYQYHPYNEN